MRRSGTVSWGNSKTMLVLDPSWRACLLLWWLKLSSKALLARLRSSDRMEEWEEDASHASKPSHAGISSRGVPLTTTATVAIKLMSKIFDRPFMLADICEWLHLLHLHVWSSTFPTHTSYLYQGHFSFNCAYFSILCFLPLKEGQFYTYLLPM